MLTFFGAGGRQRGKLEHGNAGQSRIQGPCENNHYIYIQAPCNNIDVDYTLTVSHGDKTDSLIWVSLNFLLEKLVLHPPKQIRHVETGIGL